MPEFEEPESNSSNTENYTPSKDAKPRTRRRSGGFKTAPAAVQGGFGEVDPVTALQEEKLSGKAKAAAERSKEAPSNRQPATAKPKNPSNAGSAKPSKETLAAIARVEERIAERRKERDARRAERDKKRPAKKTKSSPRQSTGKNKGLLASILGFLGLGPKTPSGKSSARQGDARATRPRSRGERSGKPRGQNRSGGKRGGKGGEQRRRGGGKGPRNGPRSKQKAS